MNSNVEGMQMIKKEKKWLLGIGFPLLAVPHVADAALITPTQAFASTYFESQQSPANLINNSGLNTSSGNVLTYTHSSHASAFNMWAAGAGQGVAGAAPVVANQYIVFNLGGSYDLSGAYLWQMMQVPIYGRGIKDFELYASSAAPSAADTSNPPAVYDLTGFTQILGPSTLAQGSGSTTSTQAFTLSGATNVRQVYLKINSAWSGAMNEIVGLSEIKFEGTAIPSAIFNWANTAGGSWQTGGNWSTGTAPTSSDDANFALNNTYTVNSSTNTTIANLNVSAGDVTLNLGTTSLQTNTINLTGGKLTVPNYVTGTAAAGQVGGALNFSNGTLEVVGGTYRPASVSFSSSTPNGFGWLSSYVISGAAGTAAKPTLELTGGATASNPSTSLHHAIVVGINGGKAAVHVSDPGSLLTLNQSFTHDANTLYVGLGGAMISGNYVRSEGTVDVSNQAMVSGVANVVLGTDGASGSATVDNATLRSTNGNLILGWRRYNNDANRESIGTLSVINGGKVSGGAAVYVGSRGGTGIATIDGVGSSLSTPSNLIVGFERYLNSSGRAGNGTLTLTNGATASGGAVFIGLYGGNGTVNVQSGATLSSPNGSILVGDNINFINPAGQGTLNVTAGGIVNAYDLYVGTRGGVTGSATVSGANSIVTTSSITCVGSDGTGTLAIENGGTLTSGGNISIGPNGGGSFASSGSVAVGKSDGTDSAVATLATAGSLTLGVGGTNGATLSVHPKGLVTIGGSLRATPPSALPANTLKVNLNGGTIRTGTTAFSDAAYFNWTGGTLWYTSGTGNISSIGADENATLNVPDGGVLKGSADLRAQLAVSGTVSPGDGHGHGTATFLARNLSIGSSGGNQGEFAADVDFTSNTADVLSITGSVTLADAKLSLSLVDAPTGQLSTPLTFLLIVNDGVDPITGTFAEIDLETYPLAHYSMNYAFSGIAVNGVGTGNDVAITFFATVPEPSTMLVTLLGTAGLLARRRSVR